MQIEIYADVVCPWCYIGKRRFETALVAHPAAADVTVTWRPFQLDPEAPGVPVPHLQAYAAKLGDVDKLATSLRDLQAAAEGVHLDLRLDQALRVNTFDAHRVVALALAAGGNEMQDRVVERLMSGYFTEGRDLSDHAVLADLANDAGLTEIDIKAYLASDEGVAQLREQLGEGRALGLDSVPTYVFERRWAVSGAQSPEVMGQVLTTIEAAMLGGGGGCCGGGGGGCACSA